MPCDYMMPQHNFQRPSKPIIPSKDNWLEESMLIKPGDMVWFTGGSKREQSTGSRINWVNPKRSISISII